MHAMQTSFMHGLARMLSVMLILVNLNAVAQQQYVSPVNGTLTSPFGWRSHPIDGASKFHSGIDIAAPQGTPVFALQPGWVVFSAPYGGYGNLVVIQHNDQLCTWHAHNVSVLKQPGDWVNAGDPISLVGATGRATGPHLHFEVRINGDAIDPLNYLASLSQSNSPVANLSAPPVYVPAKASASPMPIYPLPAKRMPVVASSQRATVAETPVALPNGVPDSNRWTVELLQGQKAEAHTFITK
jgi:hypothetical protein